MAMSTSELPSSRDTFPGAGSAGAPGGCGLMILSRVALPMTALLVIGTAGHADLPFGIGFGRFLNPTYTAKPHDWLILAALLAGVGLAIASCWRARRVLV